MVELAGRILISKILEMYSEATMIYRCTQAKSLVVIQCADNTLGPSDTMWWAILVNIGSGNGLMPNRRQAITWTSVDYRYWQENWLEKWFEILIKIQQFSLKKINVKMLYANGGHFVSASMW